MLNSYEYNEDVTEVWDNRHAVFRLFLRMAIHSLKDPSLLYDHMQSGCT